MKHDVPRMSYKTQIFKVNIMMVVNFVHNILARCSKFIGSLQINVTQNWWNNLQKDNIQK
jgi:hypothetical protein